MPALFQFNEIPKSRDSESSPPSETRHYVASGEFDEQIVKAYAYTLTPSAIVVYEGLLHRHKLSVEAAGHRLYNVTVGYEARKNQTGEMTFRFDTTGGTINVKASKSTVNKYPAGAPDYKQLIGVNGDDVVGADVVIPALKWNIGFKHPAGIVTLGFSKALAVVTGNVNSDTFLESAAGEVLFLGASGGDGTTAEAEVDYQFAFAPNLAGQVVGAITGIEQNGWDVRWIQWQDDTDAGPPIRQVKVPQFVYVERVYTRIAMASYFGFGG